MQVDVDGTRLWYEVEGSDGPTVVLLHGGPGSYDHSYFRPDFGELAEAARVVYLDLRDHGRSSRGDPAAWSFERCADDLPVFCDAVGIAQPVVYGHSMGGFVAMLAEIRHPGHARALVLQSTAARTDVRRIAEGFRRVAGDKAAEIARRLYGGEGEVTAAEWELCRRAFGPWVPGAEERSRIVQNPELNPFGMELLRRFDVVDRLREIACPTLVCVGRLDPVTPVEAAREIADALAPGVGRLEILEEAGHFPWKDVPSRYWALIKEFAA